MADKVDELLAKRRELVARRRTLKGELTGLAADISAIDRVLGMLDASYRPEAPIRSVRTHSTTASNPFPQGGMVPAMLDALRKMAKPVTSVECAEAMLASGGFEADADTLAAVSNRVSALLAQKVASGQVERAGNGHGRQVLWRIAA